MIKVLDGLCEGLGVEQELYGANIVVFFHSLADAFGNLLFATVLLCDIFSLGGIRPLYLPLQGRHHVFDVCLDGAQLVRAPGRVTLYVLGSFLFVVAVVLGGEVAPRPLPDLDFFVSVHERTVQKIDLGRNRIETNPRLDSQSPPVEIRSPSLRDPALFDQLADHPVCVVARCLDQLVYLLGSLLGNLVEVFCVQDGFSDVPNIVVYIVVFVAGLADIHVGEFFAQQPLGLSNLAPFLFRQTFADHPVVVFVPGLRFVFVFVFVFGTVFVFVYVFFAHLSGKRRGLDVDP
mmetsp:Transcript_25991/g.53388  ORF Transcript_25991/g.53388 Transcript_25991/m.53388 type:complete len:290 (+) Transcript_25991:2188-3057(+)